MIRRRRALLGMVGVVLKAVEIAGMYKEHPVTVGEVPPEQFPEFFTYSTEQFSARKYSSVPESTVLPVLSVLTELWKLSPSGFPRNATHQSGFMLEHSPPMWRTGRRE